MIRPALSFLPFALFGSALLLGGCAATLQQARPGEALAPTEVLLLGEAVYEPPSRHTLEDYGEMWLGFTWGPDTPVAPDRAHDEDLVIQVVPGAPFALVAPRQDLYLRSVTLAYRAQETATGHNRIVQRYTKCRGRVPVRLGPDDEAVYLGRIRCRHAHPDTLEVENAWPEVEGQVGEQVAGRPVTCLPCEGSPKPE